jgi:hypothetical protein
MKNKYNRILRFIMVYSFIGSAFQVIGMNSVFAIQRLDDKKFADVRIKITNNDVSLEQLFRIIEQQTDFKFFFIKEDVPLKTKVKVLQEEESLEHILQSLAKEFGLSFSRINNQIVVKKSKSLQPEIFNFQGTVRDASTNEPLAFANIVVEGTQLGTMTDAGGKFTIVLPEDTSHLRCSYVGYKTEIVDCTGQKNIPIAIRLYSMDMLLQDVTVYANYGNDETNQKEVSALSLESETIGKITGLMPDVLRSVQMLPGVSNDNELSAKFNVHGGDGNENLVLIDGTQVYEPYHVKEVPIISIGIFDVDMIKKMDLITGGFTARYGDRMSSVVDIEYREGSREQVKGQASLSMTDIDALLEGPIGGNGSFIIGARQSYTQYVLKLLKQAPQVHPSYYDVQGVLTFQPALQDKLLLKFIHAGDSFKYDPTTSSSSAFTNPYHTSDGYTGSLSQSWHDSTEEHAHYYSSMFAIQNNYIISSSALLKSEVSYYDEIESEHSMDSAPYGYVFKNSRLNVFYDITTNHLYDNNLHIQTLEFNSSYEMQIMHSYGVKTGASYQRIFYFQQLIDQTTFSDSTNRQNYPKTTYSHGSVNAVDNALGNIDAQSYKLAGYFENIFQLGEKAILNVGGRFDYFDINKDLTWSPRMNIAYTLNSELTLRGAWGYFFQSPIYQQLAHSIASDTNTQSQQAIHYILGADYNIFSDEGKHNILKLKVESYYKSYRDLISSTISSSGRINYSRRNDAIGRASGLDAYLMYSISGISGWISYSFLKANQKMEKNDTIGYFPRNTDQRNTIAFVADFDLGKAWSMNTRVVYGSGYPYTPSTAVYNKLSLAWEWHLGNPNSASLPAYKRVDLRVSKDFEVFGFPSSAFLDISNLFNFTNILAYAYQFDNQGNPEVVARNLWPILPTLGMTVRF